MREMSPNFNGSGARGGAIEGDGGGAAGEDAGDLGAVLDGAALVVDRLAGALRRSIEILQGGVVELVANEGFCRIVDDDLGRRDGAEHHARIGAGATAVER